MVARECTYCREDLCTAKSEVSEDFECEGMVKKDIVIECHAENSDLVDVCEMCECREADAGFPYDEYCKECAEEMKKENISQ